MGYERKRGKLADLNALLRGGGARPLLARRRRRSQRCRTCATSSRSTPTRSCRATRRGSSSATMAHPLNRPRFDAAQAARVARATASCSRAWRRRLPSASRSRFARLFGGEPGIDPVHARGLRRLPGPVRRRLVHRQGHLRRRRLRARAATARFPENRILSHDLLEGCYARSGLLSDVQLYEEYPSRYARRRQPPAPLDPRRLADRCAGCCRACPAPTAAAHANPLSRPVALEDLRQPAPQPRADRRSSLLLLVGWTSLPRAVAVDARRARGLVLLPALLRPSLALLRKPRELPLRPAPAAVVARDLARQLARRRCSRSPACRTRRSSASTRSLRTLWRMLVTRRDLLEWQPVERRRAQRAARGLARRCRGDVDRAGCRARGRGALVAARARRRWPSPRRSWLLWLRRAGDRLVAEPAARAARAARSTRDQTRVPAPRRAPDLGVLRDASSTPRTTGCRPTTSRSIRRAASRTARRRPTSACRCSPTWRPTTSATSRAGELIERTAATLRARWTGWSAIAGHFYNWYDTRTLQPLRAALRLDGRQRQPRRPPADAARRAASTLRRRSRSCDRRAVRRASRDTLRRCSTRRRRAPSCARVAARAGASRSLRRAARRGRRSSRRSRPRCATRSRERCGRPRTTPLARPRSTPCSPASAALRRSAPSARAVRCRRARRRRRCAARPSCAARARASRRRASSRARQRADARAPRGSRAATRWRARRRARRHRLRLPLRSRRATCSRSATTSASTGSTPSFYDLLASEARLASFVAIAQGKLPQEHWFALGRLLTDARRRAGAAVVERLDVRVPDAAAGDADATSSTLLDADLPRGRRAPDRVRRASAACRGASRSRATTRSTRS